MFANFEKLYYICKRSNLIILKDLYLFCGEGRGEIAYLLKMILSLEQTALNQ